MNLHDVLDELTDDFREFPSVGGSNNDGYSPVTRILVADSSDNEFLTRFRVTSADFIFPSRANCHFGTTKVMCGVGVDIAVHNHGIGYFYVICSGLVFFLEVAWIITLFIQVCSRNEFGPCMNCWTNVLWLRLWRKSVLYIVFASILFLKPHRLWLSIVAGLQLLVLAGLYLLLTYRVNQQSKVIPSPRLLNNSNSPSQEDNYDKYDDITDVLETGLPAPLLNDNLSELDQDTILEM